MRVPRKTQPPDVFLDGVDVLDVFFGRVGIVEAKVAGASGLLGDPEIQANGLGMPDMQVPVRFRRKARRHPSAVLPRRQVVGDDRADEINRRLRRGRSVLIRHLCVFYRVNPRRSGEPPELRKRSHSCTGAARTERIDRHFTAAVCVRWARVTNLKLAVRALRASPFVTVVAVASLALGIGANAAIFSLFDQVLLQPLPVPNPAQLVNLSSPGPKQGNSSCNNAGGCDEIFSYPMFRDLERAQTVAFAGLAAHRLIRRQSVVQPTDRQRQRHACLGLVLSRPPGAPGVRTAARAGRRQIDRRLPGRRPWLRVLAGAPRRQPHRPRPDDDRQRPDHDDCGSRGRRLPWHHDRLEANGVCPYHHALRPRTLRSKASRIGRAIGRTCSRV